MDSLFLDSAPDEPEWMAVLNNMDGHRPGLSSPQLPLPPLPSPPPAISRPFYRPCKSSPSTMKEMIYSVAALTPVRINRELLKARPRRNVRISNDPQSVVARRRRRRIGERFRMLQQLVPGGAGMDTASMLDEAIRYVKFLQEQVRRLEALAAEGGSRGAAFDGGINYSVYQAAAGALHLDLAPMLS